MQVDSNKLLSVLDSLFRMLPEKIYWDGVRSVACSANSKTQKTPIDEI